ncbi:MAG: DJ-1/PfpI family protein [Gammaproteobacteria bacterium]|nr:DJ-1/PfpI family protein [Gammaproteobacteria bacterium]MCP5417169.1 DJ-1/PfpI family protein [Chromatiaceae bacterium]
MARTLVPLAQGCEELEAITVIDLLRRAGVEVVSAGLDAQPVRASRGVVLVPDTTLDQVLDEPFDMIVLPGGLPGADHLNQDPRIHRLLQTMHQNGCYTAAICAAPKVLAAAGLLEGRCATAYPGTLEKTGRSGISIESSAVVRDGTIITSRGPGTAMDFALELIELLLGGAKRQQVEQALVR